jgi:hypothetical protein
MDFLSPITALAAAAAAVPLLLLLYFLKLRRHERMVSSTLLWKRAVQDLQVNAPFQRLRRNILLLLQMLVLLALLAALARPVLSLRPGEGRRYVLLIDRSASMTTVERDGRTRLDLAKRGAREFVDTLRTSSASLEDLALGGSADRAMVVAFDGRAKVLCSFTSDKRRLKAAIDGIEPTHGPSRLSEPLRVARAFAQPVGEEANNRSATARAQLELFSDGRIADLDETVIQPGELNYHRLGSAAGNVSILAMQARRDYERPQTVRVFAAVGNYGAEPARCDVQLSIDGVVRAVEPVSLPARAVEAEGEPARPGRASVTFELSQPTGGVVEVRQLREDPLACDDAAWGVLPPPQRLKAMLVTEGNIALHSALRACPLAELKVVAPAEFEALAAAEVETGWDLVILDNYTPKELPRCRYVVFGRPPAASGVTPAGQGEDQVVVDWRSSHPVLQHVDLSELYVREYFPMKVPRDAQVLAEFGDSPAMVVVRRRGSAMLLVGFDVTQTNWPFEPGFVMFCYNATHYMGLEIGRGEDRRLAVGEAITVEAGSPAAGATVTAPDGTDRSVRADASGMVRYPDTHLAGLYRVSPEQAGEEFFAVNVLDAAESRIAPAETIELSGERITAGAGDDALANRDLWPLLVLVTLALVCVEWLVYNSKVRL